MIISCALNTLFFNKTWQMILLYLFVIVSPVGGWKFPGQTKKAEVDAPDLKNGIAGIFFDETYGQHGFSYAYPKTSNVEISKKIAKNGKIALMIDLAVDSFSGASVCLHDKQFNLRPYFKKGAIQFWIKGAMGAEKAWVALVDEAESDGKKTVVRVDVDWFGKISTAWSFISIPLEHFGEQGVYWDESTQREIDAPFDWNKVAEFRIESRKDENTSFRVWVDDIIIVKSLR